jgi:hypothetical protein
MREVLVRGEERQVVTDAQLGKQCIYGADLDTSLAACIAQGRGIDMVGAVWLKQWQGGKVFDDLGLRLWTREALQELLENQACCDDHVRAEQGIFELVHLWLSSLGVTPKCQRPDTRVNQEGHLRRDRSAL